jgi:hypothetical protein
MAVISWRRNIISVSVFCNKERKASKGIKESAI